MATTPGQVGVRTNSVPSNKQVSPQRVVPTVSRPGVVQGNTAQSQEIAPRPARLSISSSVSKEQAKGPKPSGVVLINTNDLGDQWFRCALYGPTNSRKTVTAATFGSPEEVRIILTRRKEQLRPLEGLGYQAALVNTAAQLESVLTHPETYWTDPTWVKNPNRTLIVDDITEGIALLVDDNAVIDGREVKDPRRSYNAAGKSLRTWIQLSFRAPQHIILNALEKTKETAAGERINLDIPPSMLGMLTTDLEYVFYIKTNLWKLLVERKRETFTKMVDGKEDDLTREIFAKNKQRFVPNLPQQKSIFGVDENMNLRAIWDKIRNAKKQQIAAASGKR